MVPHPDTMKSKNSDSTKSSSVEIRDPGHQKALWAAEAALDKKAENLKILDVSEFSGFTDYFVICSAMNDKQVQAIVDSIEQRLKAENFKPLGIEGYAESRWVLVDFGEVVIHVFLDAIRDYYNIEALWADAASVPVPSEFYGPSADRLN